MSWDLRDRRERWRLMTKYVAMIGLEMHCEISKTNSKVFSGAKNGYSTKANVNIRPLDMAFPGTLPVVNKEAVKKALTASLILNCKQPEYLYFERKNYYYPDLPKGYQITQETKPAPVGIYGYLDYEVNGETKRARINNIHLEEDSASLDHFSLISLIDYNRSGVPLLELVTEPDFRNSDEAVAFLETMRSIYQYADISDADSKKGQIRCDVNVSIVEEDKDLTDPKNWGTKVEIKNVNSFSGVRGVINYEISRQIALKENGTYDEMEQQTRRWDEEAMETKYMRGKVDAIDYKYFIEPNIPKFKITKEWLEEIKSAIPPLANERKKKYIEEYGLKGEEAAILVRDKMTSDYFDAVIEKGVEPKDAINWITTIILGAINKLDMSLDEFFITPAMLAELIKMITSGKISKNQAKNALYEAIDKEKNPLDIIAESGAEQISDEADLKDIASRILDAHPKEVTDYLEKGLTNIINFFLGQVMKETKGKANPALTMQILKSELEKRRK